jgi:hypothetical protein
MAITPSHQEAEERFRELLESGGIAPPDEVEYEAASVVFFWHEPKLAVFLDLDDADVEAIDA